MDQLTDFLRELWNSEAFMPRWVCGEWSELHGWMYIISDVVIFLAYMAIPITMLIFVRKRWNDVPFKPVFWLYILFITFCGVTHLVDAVIFYVPLYRLNALILALTAIVSTITVGALIYVLPRALAYKSPMELELVVDQKTAELQTRVEELNKLSENVSRKKEQLEQFAYITSHNLRSPISNLKSLMDLVRSAEDADDKRIILEKVEQSVESIMNTVNDVSNVVKQSSPQVQAEEVSFKQVINEVLASHEQELNAVDAQVEMNLEVDKMVYPPDHFRSIIQNLIDNAVKYRKKDTPFQLQLSTFNKDGRVVFQCADNGIGIDLEKNGDKIFKLYKTVNRDDHGKGIGLFLVRNQLENLNGFVNLTSKLGIGTTVTVTFGEVP